MTHPDAPTTAAAFGERLRDYFREHGWAIHMDDREGQPLDPFPILSSVAIEREAASEALGLLRRFVKEFGEYWKNGSAERLAAVATDARAYLAAHATEEQG